MRSGRGRQRAAFATLVRAPRSAPPGGGAKYSIRNAYARVAAAVNLDVGEVRQLWLSEDKAARRDAIPVLTRAHILALEMLRMSEDELRRRIEHWIVVANRTHPLVDGQPRFLYYHTYNSALSPTGFPDMLLLDRLYKRLYAWEEKREDGEPTTTQALWLDELGHVSVAAGWPSPGPMRVLGIIRPSNADSVKSVLDL